MVVSSQHEVEDLKQKLADAEGDIKVGPWLPLALDMLVGVATAAYLSYMYILGIAVS